MSSELRYSLNQVIQGFNLSPEEMKTVVGQVMDGQGSEILMAGLLTALHLKGESVSELVGAARAMSERATAIPVNETKLLDTCGTGGDKLHTFNISTATAFVAAGCGVKVAKHGNRSVSSSSGSADVLEALGVKIQLSPELVGKCTEEVGIGFCFAQLFHGAMKNLAPIRRELGIRTIFNLLGPLTNPANAQFQLLGVSSRDAAEKIAVAASQLGREHAIVVCGADQLDEVSLWGQTTAYVVRGKQTAMQTWTPPDFGLPACRVQDLKATSAANSADIIRRVFSGEKGACRNIVLANSAAALLAADEVTTLAEGVAKAEEAIDKGKVQAVLDHLVTWTTSAAETSDE